MNRDNALTFLLEIIHLTYSLKKAFVHALRFTSLAPHVKIAPSTPSTKSQQPFFNNLPQLRLPHPLFTLTTPSHPNTKDSKY